MSETNMDAQRPANERQSETKMGSPDMSSRWSPAEFHAGFVVAGLRNERKKRAIL